VTPKKLIRAMSARRSSTLSCGHYVLAGALIVKVDGRWICAPCRLDSLRELEKTMTTPPQPGRGADTEQETT
jgi:hypothetical protein